MSERTPDASRSGGTRTACSCVVEDVKGGESPPAAERAGRHATHRRAGRGLREALRPEYEPMLRVGLPPARLRRRAPRRPPTTPSPRSTSGGDRIDDHGAYLRTCVVNRCRDLQRRRRLERQRHAGSHRDLRRPRRPRAARRPRRAARSSNEPPWCSATTRASRKPRSPLALDMPVGTVKSTVSRALTQLREAVER